MKLISLAVITLLAVTTAAPAAPAPAPAVSPAAPAPAPVPAPAGSPAAPGPAPAGSPAAPGPAPAPAPGPAGSPAAPGPAPASSPAKAPGAPVPAPAGVTAPAPATAAAPGGGPVGAPGSATGIAANTNPNADIPAQPSAGVAAAPARTGDATPTPFPSGSPGATEKKGVKFCKFCCVNAQRGTWTPGPGRKSGCADRAGSNAVYKGCCDRLGDCCPVSIGLPSNLYQCCDSSKKEVCGGTIYQPTCTIDFTIPDPVEEEKSQATPSPVGAPAAVAAPAGSPAPAPATSPAFNSACGRSTQNLVTASKLPGTCFRRCDVRGNGYGYGRILARSNGFRQFGAMAYSMTYSANRVLPSAVPSFNYYNAQVGTQNFQPIFSAAYDQESCSCDTGCESRGDCCFDYCSFCVVN